MTATKAVMLSRTAYEAKAKAKTFFSRRRPRSRTWKFFKAKDKAKTFFLKAKAKDIEIFQGQGKAT